MYNYRMGFPIWTLVGMGITAVLALIMTIFAYVAQSPRALLRLGLGGYRLDLRVKLFTGYALASLILLLGFFLAGVPLDDSAGTTAVATPVSNTASSELAQLDSGAMSEPPTPLAEAQTTPGSDNPEANNADGTVQTPASGAFGGPPPDEADAAVTQDAPPSATPEQVGPSATPNSASTATAVSTDPVATANSSSATATPSPTMTATPLPTATPSPTVTPTPIEGKTGLIDTDGSTLWVRRSPGGQQLVLVRDNEVVLIENGRANQGGILWREIRTVNDIVGWVQAEFLIE